MKNTKRVLAFLVGAAMMLPMASAEGKLASGNYEANAQGFGGAVTVKSRSRMAKSQRLPSPAIRRPRRLAAPPSRR